MCSTALFAVSRGIVQFFYRFTFFCDGPEVWTFHNIFYENRILQIGITGRLNYSLLSGNPTYYNVVMRSTMSHVFVRPCVRVTPRAPREGMIEWALLSASGPRSNSWQFNLVERDRQMDCNWVLICGVTSVVGRFDWKLRGFLFKSI